MGSYRSEPDPVPQNRPPSGDAAPGVEILAEAERGQGWTYACRIDWRDGTTTDHRLTLSWADHDHISGGAVPPEKVAIAVLSAIARAMDPVAIPATLDVSTARRLIDDLDARVREGL